MIIKENMKKAVLKAKDIFNIIMPILLKETPEEREREHFYVLGLDTALKVRYLDLCSLGSLTASVVHVREVFRLAILKGCVSIACVHNHPAGQLNPSREDIAVTKRLQEAGELLGIKLVDHVIIGDETYISLLEKGYMDE